MKLPKTCTNRSDFTSNKNPVSYSAHLNHRIQRCHRCLKGTHIIPLAIFKRGQDDFESPRSSSITDRPSPEDVAQAINLIRQQQQEHSSTSSSTNTPSTNFKLTQTSQIVETAMLAAVSGLVYTLSTLLRVEGYVSYLLPLPVIIAALRRPTGGPIPAAKTTIVAFILLFILMGPVRAVSYVLLYGMLAFVLGTCWSLRLPWAVSIPAGAAARIAGYFAYIALSSWVTNENLLALMMSNVHALLDQMSALIGTSGAPSPMTVAITIGSLLFVNSLFYVAMTHVLYSIVLKGLGYELRVPNFMKKMIPSTV